MEGICFGWKNCVGALVVSGDFNNLLSTNDRIGSLVKPGKVQNFQECFDKLQKKDVMTHFVINRMGLQGCILKWTRLLATSSGYRGKIKRRQIF